MKPYDYYQTTSVLIPTKDKYMTIYYYRKGKMVGMKSQFDEDFEPPKNCVEEKVLDEVSYQAHLKIYHEEIKKLQDEFCNDLIKKYDMVGHLKARECFNKAWDFGETSGLYAVEDYFRNIVELIKDDPYNPYFEVDDAYVYNDSIKFCYLK